MSAETIGMTHSLMDKIQMIGMMHSLMDKIQMKLILSRLVAGLAREVGGLENGTASIFTNHTRPIVKQRAGVSLAYSGSSWLMLFDLVILAGQLLCGLNVARNVYMYS